ncbi:ectoine/hydroxyectoine ABC transporter permease subunit EhuC [Spelaeicoccus albus]|uniref:Polar amino acid transport system permease protein n=1 Tax=Spelaeicoccus albus TaxID=1280376 RepID=A0A7Z0D1Q6_9MICO|nr:ectoine/hydroxyectoine ABC transporter permease subunit EhuC [Spelaeicoccus albus]NYI66642.1 polar amino acid transport system permease protein [Spelaeicoccus albus]
MGKYFEALGEALPFMLDGLLLTVELTIGGALLAFVIAVVLGMGARQKNIWVRGLCRTVIEFFRGTSLVVQLFFVFYVVPQLFDIKLPSLWVGIIGLGLNYGAYGAEVVRGSINSVPSGQWEATTALSMGAWQRFTRVIFPQAWALMIPSLTNLLIQLLKGTAIVYVILMHDLTYETDKLRTDTSTYFAYAVGLLVYFAVAYLFTLVMNALEVRAKHNLGRGESLREALSFKAPTKETAGASTGGGMG